MQLLLTDDLVLSEELQEAFDLWVDDWRLAGHLGLNELGLGLLEQAHALHLVQGVDFGLVQGFLVRLLVDCTAAQAVRPLLLQFGGLELVGVDGVD